MTSLWAPLLATTRHDDVTNANTYDILRPQSTAPYQVPRSIWKLKTLPKIQLFLWVAWQGKILSNFQRVKRHLADDASCFVCGDSLEDEIHILRDCRAAKMIWKIYVPEVSINEFFNCDKLAWWSNNLIRDKNVGIGQWLWGELFACVCWRIWKWRNESCFKLMSRPLVFKVKAIADMMKEVSGTLSKGGTKFKSDVLFHWDKPDVGVFKLNVDGSWNQVTSMAGVGGVIRDMNGTWIHGFSRRCGLCSIDSAELWGILTGMQLAWRLGLRRIEVESDSLSSVNMIAQGVNSKHPQTTLVRAIQNLIENEWECNISYIPRQKNCVADWLAKHSLFISTDFVYFNSPPVAVNLLLLADNVGVSYPRLVNISN